MSLLDLLLSLIVVRICEGKTVELLVVLQLGVGVKLMEERRFNGGSVATATVAAATVCRSMTWFSAAAVQ